MAKKYENIENIGKLISGGAVAELSKKISVAEKAASDILKKLNDIETAIRTRRYEEEQAAIRAAEAEAAAKLAAEKPAQAEAASQPLTEVAEQPSAPAEAVAEPVREAQPVATPVEEAKPAATPVAPAEQPAQTAQPAQPAEKPRPSYIRGHVNPAEPRPARPENRTFINRDSRPQRPDPRGQRPAGQSYQPRNGAAPTGARPVGGQRYTSPAAVPPVQPNKGGKNFGPDKKKQTFEKTYVEKGHSPLSKRALQKQQGASIDDFDENKSGYRKLRVKKAQKNTAQSIKIEHAVVTTDDIPLKVLSEKLGVGAAEITKRLFKEGIMKTVNESIDYDTAALIAAGLGIELEYKPEKTAEEVLFEQQADTVEEIESLVPRAPVVTVMGHVGKPSLLDSIRKAHVTSGEAGGITQHIGAYTVTVQGKGITFIDTPGHEAFTAMRARGAQVTDIVILVVAADDGIMPQTVEAINHAKAAKVDIIVAVNKIDKPAANVDKVKQELTEYNLVPEEWGGETMICPVSCKTGEGIDNLLESLLLKAEMKELLANPAREARGVIIEAQLDKGKGPVATVLVQNGTLRTGDNLVSGMVSGKVRAMIDDRGRTVKEAGPSMAVNVLGLDAVPNSGEAINAVSSELMKRVQAERKRKLSDDMTKKMSKVSLDDAFAGLEGEEKKNLNLIIKGDVQGSVEAIKQSVVKLTNDEVQVKVIHSAAGAVTESDVMLAESSKAIILAFNVRPDPKAKALAERSKVDVRTYRIIYDLLDDMEAALKGMRAPKYQENLLGKCEVRQTFKITGVGNIAGCMVLDGKIVRGGKLRIYRDDILIVEGGVKQLKRFKDDVKEVAAGYECGCSIEGFNDIKIGDIIECYLIEEIKQD